MATAVIRGLLSSPRLSTRLAPKTILVLALPIVFDEQQELPMSGDCLPAQALVLAFL